MGTMSALLLVVVVVVVVVVVGRGSRTINSQRSALAAQVAELTALQLQNEVLHRRAINAARQAVFVNENELRRIAADVHDGPLQDLGLALMMLDASPLAQPAPSTADPGDVSNTGDVSAIGHVSDVCNAGDSLRRARTALQSALTDLRAICADLDLPDIADRTLAEVAARAARFSGQDRPPDPVAGGRRCRWPRIAACQGHALSRAARGAGQCPPPCTRGAF